MKDWFKRRVLGRVSAPLSDEDFVAVLHAAGVRTDGGDWSWRCGCCGHMQHKNVLRALIPDGTLPRDPMWAVLERCRRMAYNGQFTAWCLSCCRALTPMTPAEMLTYDHTPHDPIPVDFITVSTPDREH
jgi:hypothetical protein